MEKTHPHYEAVTLIKLLSARKNYTINSIRKLSQALKHMFIVKGAEVERGHWRMDVDGIDAWLIFDAEQFALVAQVGNSKEECVKVYVTTGAGHLDFMSAAQQYVTAAANL